MRRADREISDKTEIEEILGRARVCHLGLCDKGVPYVVPMNYGYMGNTLYFHCAPSGRKLDILRENSCVSFAVYIEERLVESGTACKWTMKYRSVMGTGKASQISSQNEKERALQIIMRHYSSLDYDIDRTQADRVAIIKVAIETLSGKKSV